MDGAGLSVDTSVVVVGAGAAGLIASWRAAQLGAKVLLLEKTPRLGTKILISGGGKCNITHDGPIEDVLRAFRPNEARFLRPSCYRFTNHDIVRMLTDQGLTVMTRPDGRIFPVDKTAKDVVAILGGYLARSRVEIRTDTAVTNLVFEAGRVVGVKAGKSTIPADRVILATGGSSYPNSGTTGDGWPWAKAAGHTIVKVRAALAPMYLALEDHDAAHSGVALRDIVLRARLKPTEGKTKELARWRDDLLFTHQGVSGPTVLGISREVAESQSLGVVELLADLHPDKTPEAISQLLIDFCRDHPRRSISGFVSGWVPERLVPVLLGAAGIPDGCIGANLDRKGRNRLVDVAKGWNLGRVRAVPLEKGEVVAGGISLDEVDPHTMASKLVKGLYLCGEVLDIAGPVGGYNLQAAFATGYVAGESAVS
ncbi:MAG: NAD(P)/FAD-dependent oxidoreductase [Fimbriimonas sp.]